MPSPPTDNAAVLPEGRSNISQMQGKIKLLDFSWRGLLINFFNRLILCPFIHYCLWNIISGNVSPLTPPPLTVRPASPRTPPLPPQFRQTGLITATQEEVTDPTPLPLIPLPPLPDHENVQLHEEVVPAINSNTRSGKNGSEMSICLKK